MEGYDQYLIRFIPAKDDERGAITIPTEVHQGASLWMTRRDFEKIANGVEQLGAKIKGQLGDKPAKLMFQFDCAGRGRALLRDQQKQELLDRLQQHMPDVPWLGFYTYGEIGPVGGHNCFHNYTAVVVAIH